MELRKVNMDGQSFEKAVVTESITISILKATYFSASKLHPHQLVNKGLVSKEAVVPRYW